MNNKKVGTAFERALCDFLSKYGFWVHFLTPDIGGAQPFDIIAVRNDIAYAIDCKTCKSGRFSYGRLEDNQIMAFERWLKLGNSCPIIAVEHEGAILWVDYLTLKKEGSVALSQCAGGIQNFPWHKSGVDA